MPFCGFKAISQLNFSCMPLVRTWMSWYLLWVIKSIRKNQHTARAHIVCPDMFVLWIIKSIRRNRRTARTHIVLSGRVCPLNYQIHLRRKASAQHRHTSSRPDVFVLLNYQIRKASAQHGHTTSCPDGLFFALPNPIAAKTAHSTDTHRLDRTCLAFGMCNWRWRVSIDYHFPMVFSLRRLSCMLRLKWICA